MDCHSSKKNSKANKPHPRLSKGEPQRVKPSYCSKHNLLQKQMWVTELISFKSHSRLGAHKGGRVRLLYLFLQR